MEQVDVRLQKIKQEVDNILQDVKTNKEAIYNIEEIEYLSEEISQTLFLITQNIKGAFRLIGKE